MNFFQSVTNLEELKKQYRKLALKHHPDKGGNEKDFIQLKKEYDQLFEKLNKTEETSNAYKNIIDSLINFDIDLEIIGTWVWVSGPNTFAIKDQLKELGFKWAGKKKAWYWHEGEYKAMHKKNFSLDEIRTMHEVKKIKTNSKKVLGA
jgi:curved DNA-binding protein CbpA